MKHAVMAAIAGLWMSVAGAAPLPAWHNALPEPAGRLGQALDTATGQWLSAEQLVQRLASADRILMGEQHDNDDHHRLQLWC